MVPEVQPRLQTDFDLNSLFWVGVDTGPLLYVAPRVRRGMLEVFPVSDNLLFTAIVNRDLARESRDEVRDEVLRILNDSDAHVLSWSRSVRPKELHLPRQQTGKAYLVCLSVGREEIGKALFQGARTSQPRLLNALRRSLERDTFDLAATLAIDLPSGTVNVP